MDEMILNSIKRSTLFMELKVFRIWPYSPLLEFVALHEEPRPSKFEANSCEILTQAKKEGLSNTTPQKKLGFHFDPIQFSSLGPYHIFFLVHSNMISPH